MKRFAWLLIAVCGAGLLAGAAARDALHFPLHKFSIAPLEVQTAGQPATLMSMYLPPSDQFAPNVNVVSQPWPGSLDQYITTSKQEFAHNGLQLLKADKADDNTVTMEYAGNMQGRPLHFYAKAGLKNHEVLLATATATDRQWPAVSPRLRACIDSFQRD